MRVTRRRGLVLAVLLAAAIALITFDFRGGSPLRGVGASVFGPIEGAANAVVTPVGNFFSGLGGRSRANAQIAALQKANATLRGELSAAQLSRSDQKQLSSLLGLAGKGGYRIVPASVITVGRDYSDSVTLDVGSKAGVRAEETVLNGQGLVGTVTSVSADTSTVLLATDASSKVGARTAGSDQIGAVTGTGTSFGAGSQSLNLTLFNGHTGLQPGNRLVTFGSVGNQPYVPGVPIGTVTSVGSTSDGLTTTAKVRPFVDFTSLGVVGVVVSGPAKNPGTSVLPPSPSPSPTVTVTVRPSGSAGAMSSPGSATSGSSSPASPGSSFVPTPGGSG